MVDVMEILHISRGNGMAELLKLKDEMDNQSSLFHFVVHEKMDDANPRPDEIDIAIVQMIAVDDQSFNCSRALNSPRSETPCMKNSRKYVCLRTDADFLHAKHRKKKMLEESLSYF
uniref:Uncharacterized protein n=1 Tax=Romanomermis culicivorax TaxID=13658 RepID=A0A915HQW5_ROMCU